MVGASDRSLRAFGAGELARGAAPIRVMSGLVSGSGGKGCLRAMVRPVGSGGRSPSYEAR